MIFNILTLFPGVVSCFFRESIISKAIDKSLIEINIVDIREFSRDKHKKVDDYPFGGGQGMIIGPDAIFNTFDSLKKTGYVLYTTPKGNLLNQQKVMELAKYPVLTILCGHYEGIDRRVIDNLVDEEISVGDYVITGGEIAAAIIIDAVARQIDGVLGNERSKVEESFDESGLLEYDQYTRPANYKGLKVPELLRSGNHKEIDKWRKKSRLKNTLIRRLDLILRLIQEDRFTDEYKQLLEEIRKELDDEHY